MTSMPLLHPLVAGGSVIIPIGPELEAVAPGPSRENSLRVEGKVEMSWQDEAE